MFDFGKLKEKVNNLKKSSFIRKNDKILIAFSGGPDSVFLYRVLSFLKVDYSLELSLLYVNHNLRYDVENDLKFAKKFSEKNDSPLYIKSVNVNDYAAKNRKSIELAARELRYLTLEETLNNIGYNKIATGHNLDDNAETFVFRLLRGTSVKGLKSIPEIRGNIIRPILSFEKKEILDCLKFNEEEYIKDYTNEENEYTRNYIRNKIFPLFSKVNPNFREKIDDLILEINDLEISNKENERETKENFVEYLKDNKVEISRRKINQIYNSIFKEDGNADIKGSKEFNLGNNRFLRNEYGNLKIIEKTEIIKKTEKEKNSENEDNNIKVLKINQSIEWYNYTIYLYDKSKMSNEIFYNNKDTSYIFLKFVENSINTLNQIIIRKRREGDKILLNNLGHKKVKKILIDKKISKWERDTIPIIEFENLNNKEILAVGDLNFSIKLRKIEEEKINTIAGNEKMLIIGRKNGR